MKAKILNASAGSGKTYQLAYKYVYDVVEQPARYRSILAVTFTNKATEEMKSRILKEIHRLASGRPSSYLANLCAELSLDAETVRRRAAEAQTKILHDYSRFTVLTIDTFFQRILRAFIKELGLDLNYNIEIETAPLLSKSTDTLIEGITADRELLRWLTDFVQERIESGSGWDLRDGILSLGKEIFREENKATLGAMRSKEELAELVRRMHRAGEARKNEVTGLAAEMLRVIEEAGLSDADFTRRIPIGYLRDLAAGNLYEYTEAVAKRSRSTEGWCSAKSPARPLLSRLQPMLAEVCAAYDAGRRVWNTEVLLRKNYRSFALLSDLYAQVQRLCDEQNLMLLSETKYILSKFIGDNEAPFIYEKVGNRFECFMIDEFQDTSLKEWENFLPLLRNAMAQSERNSVFLVGDIKQSIYRWRGGDWQILRSEARRALGAGETEEVALKANYRSLPVIVCFNNLLIRRAVDRDNARLNALLQEALQKQALSAAECAALRDTLANAYRELEQTPCRQSEHPGYVSVERYGGEPPVVERICQLIDKGFRPCDILILVRSKSDGIRIAAELLDFKRTNGDPRYRFDVMTREALLVGAAPVCSFVVAALRLALNESESLALAEYNRFLQRPFARPLDAGERAFFRSLRLLLPEEAFERLLCRYAAHFTAEHTAYLQALHEQIIDFCANRIADIPLFLRWWNEQGAAQSLSIEQSDSTIEVTTIHAAKGLEKPAILLPYCSWPLDPLNRQVVWAESGQGETRSLGRFPVEYGRSMEASEFSDAYYREQVYANVDNINLLYVALTRAAESLHIFIPDRKRGEHVGALLWQCLTEAEDPLIRRAAAVPEGRESADEADEAPERFEAGEFAGPVRPERRSGDEEPPVQHLLKDYATAMPQTELSLPSQRYFEEGERELSPRNFGILMHRAFQEAADEAGIREAVAQMQRDALLLAEEAEVLNRRIDEAFRLPEVREWFDGSWEQVRNENSIILPEGDAQGGSVSTKRPDRVMLKGDRAVVVDYKFGKREGEASVNRRQIRSYLDLLRRMGYRRCEGYLWYVRLGEIEPVAAQA